MEDKLCYAEEDAELERDWKTCLDFDDTPHHEPILRPYQFDVLFHEYADSIFCQFDS